MVPPSLQFSRSRDFGIVIDAGSSGSRIMVYSWIKPEVEREMRLKKGETLEALIRVEKGVERGEEWVMRASPGISTYGSDPQSVNNHLDPLLAHAKSLIPPSQIPTTPIYLLATAGMRLLPTAQREALLAEACSIIRSFGFSMHNGCGHHVRVISGEEEGLFGWVAVNYLLDGFDAHLHADGEEEEGEQGSSTFGFLDMGGASTQIAFEPSSQARRLHADNLTPVKLKLLNGRDVEHQVFVTTWLGYGTNRARERYVDSVIEAYLEEEKGGKPREEVGSERPMTVVTDPCLPKDLVLAESRHAGYSLRGTGEWDACLRRTSPLLNKTAPCYDEPCLFNGVHVPPIDFSVNHFIGISEYWYSTQEVFSLGGVYDFIEFERKALEWCSQDWGQIVEGHSAVREGQGHDRKLTIDQARLEMQCFKAAWLVNILHEGIGVPRIGVDQGKGEFNLGFGDHVNHTEEGIAKAGEKGLGSLPPAFQSLNDVNGVAISWTLGTMVLEVAKSAGVGLTAPLSGIGGVKHFEGALDNDFGHIPQAGLISGLFSVIGTIDPIFLIGFCVLVCGLWYYASAPKRRRQGDLYLSDIEGGPRDAAHSRTSSGVLVRILLPLRWWKLKISRFWSARSIRRGATLPIAAPLVPVRPRMPRGMTVPATLPRGSEGNGYSEGNYLDAPMLPGFIDPKKLKTKKDVQAGLTLSTSSSATNLRAISQASPGPLTPPATPPLRSMSPVPNSVPKKRNTSERASSDAFLSIPSGASTPPYLESETSTRPSSRNSMSSNFSRRKDPSSYSDDFEEL
ncbi:hypothetical protein BT69DRAFT_1261802 [Atractiella rhizophila]|nr:hypothetical protein BT69DRAFT_1261802 [Atractiella rhizophila]